MYKVLKNLKVSCYMLLYTSLIVYRNQFNRQSALKGGIKFDYAIVLYKSK